MMMCIGPIKTSGLVGVLMSISLICVGIGVLPVSAATPGAPNFWEGEPECGVLGTFAEVFYDANASNNEVLQIGAGVFVDGRPNDAGGGSYIATPGMITDTGEIKMFLKIRTPGSLGGTEAVTMYLEYFIDSAANGNEEVRRQVDFTVVADGQLARYEVDSWIPDETDTTLEEFRLKGATNVQIDAIYLADTGDVASVTIDDPVGSESCTNVLPYDSYECGVDGSWTLSGSAVCDTILASSGDDFNPVVEICYDQLPSDDGVTCTPWVCSDPVGGIDLTNTTVCTGDEDDLTSPENRSIVSICTSAAKCEYVCASGYEYDAGECIPAHAIYTCETDGTWSSDPNTCSSIDALSGPYTPTDTVCRSSAPADSLCEPYACTGPTPGNATACTGDGIPPVSAEPRTVVTTCDVSECEYVCDTGYENQGGVCVPAYTTYTCETDGDWTAVTNTCSSLSTLPLGDAYRPDETVCATSQPSADACDPWVCTGSLPGNATVCAGNGDPLKADATRTVVATCDESECEYTCDAGYENQGGVCVPEYTTYTCGTDGTWSGIANDCPTQTDPLVNDYRPGDTVCRSTTPSVNACDPWVCLGSDPENTTACVATNPLSADETKTVANTCGGDACEYICIDGYSNQGGTCIDAYLIYTCNGVNGAWEAAGSTCTTLTDEPYASTPGTTVCADNLPTSSCDIYICQGTLPTNATTCGNDETTSLPDGSQSYINLSDCGGDTGKKCEFACDAGYSFDDPDGDGDGTCEPAYTTYTCQTDGNWDGGVDDSCSSVDYDAGVVYSPGVPVCVLPATVPSNTTCGVFDCTGSEPSNATICDDDNVDLTGDTPITLMESCSTPKCQYICDIGYKSDGSSCVALYTQYRCQNDGTWNDLGPGCAAETYNDTAPYTPGQTTCTAEDPQDTTCVVCQDGQVDMTETCDDANAYDTDSCLTTCEDASCGDGYVYGDGSGTEECDGHDGCDQATCTWFDVDCTLSVSGTTTVTLGETVTFVYSTYGSGTYTGALVTPLNFGDSIDTGLSYSGTVEYLYTSPGVFTAEFTVLSPGIVTPLEPLASRVRQTCEVDITVQGGDCGNGVIDAGEECGEPGLDCSDGGICNPYICGCQLTCDEEPYTLVEECDDGPTCADGSACGSDDDCTDQVGDTLCEVRSGDGCSLVCEDEYCGDSTLQSSEVCEYTGPDATAGCTTLCRLPFCGDGVIQSGEACDPSSRCQDSSDTWVSCVADQSVCVGGYSACQPRAVEGCDTSCEITPYCGDGTIDDGTNGTVNLGELCDEGVLNGEGTCNTDCNRSYCGDGITQSPNGELDGDGAPAPVYEQCDDGLTCADGSSCTESGSCDDASACIQRDDDGCSSQCTADDTTVGICGETDNLGSIDPLTVDPLNLDSGLLCIAGTAQNWLLVGDSYQWQCVPNIPAGMPQDYIDSVIATCTLPGCGDGYLDDGETCDMGVQNGQGLGCSAECVQQDLLNPIDQATSSVARCVEPGAYPVVHPDEYLPFWWQGDQATNTTDSCEGTDDNGKYLTDSATCYFAVMRGSGLSPEGVFTQPCFDVTPGVDSPLFGANAFLIKDALGDYGVAPTDENLLGVSYLAPNTQASGMLPGVPTTRSITLDTESETAEQYGQYQIILWHVEYDYCGLRRVTEIETIYALCSEDDIDGIGPGTVLPEDEWGDYDFNDPNDLLPVCEYERETQQAGGNSPVTVPMWYNNDGASINTDGMTPVFEELVAPVCTLPFTISKPYFIQKGVTFQEIENTSLGDIRDIDNVSFTTDNTILDNEGAQGGSVASLTETQREYLLEGFVDTYGGAARIEVGQWNTESVMKVPREDIFFYEGSRDITFNTNTLDQFLTVIGADIDEAFTLVMTHPDADLIIDGSIEKNAMYIVEGQIRFEPDSCDDQNDVVQGMLLTKGGFTATELRNNDLDDDRCKRGGLVVRGLMFGPGIDANLFNTRRSALSAWGMELFDNNLIGNAAELFDTCYAPTLVFRHLLDVGGQSTQVGEVVSYVDAAGNTARSLFKVGAYNQMGSVSSPSGNHGPVNFPAFHHDAPWDMIEGWTEDGATGVPIEHCTIETYEYYRPMVDAVKRKVTESLSEMCPGGYDAGSTGNGGENTDGGTDLPGGPLDPDEVIPPEVVAYMSYLQVDLGWVDEQLVRDALGEKLRERYGPEVSCDSTSSIPVTEEMIGRALKDEFNVLKAKFVGFDLVGTTFFTYNGSIAQNLASNDGYSIAFDNIYHGQRYGSVNFLTFGTVNEDGIRIDESGGLGHSLTDQINDSLVGGSTVLVENIPGQWSDLPPGGEAFIEEVISQRQ